MIITSLRSYRDIITIEENRQVLSKIISSSADLFSSQSSENFIEGIVQQLASLLVGSKDTAYLTSLVVGPKPIEQYDSTELYVFTGKGDYENKKGNRLEQVITGRELISCQYAYANKTMVFEDEYLVVYCESKTKKGSLLYMLGLPRRLTKTDKDLVNIFSRNVQVAFYNVLLNRDIEDTQREIIECIADTLEANFGSENHSKRMIKICEVLAGATGPSKKEIKTLCLAVPIHEMGKIRILDNLLRNAGGLNKEEMLKVRYQADIGFNLLKGSDRPLIKVAAMITRDHNEYWDGNGYPKGKSGEEIHIFCRIINIANAFDTMRNKGNCKEAWPLKKVMEVMAAEKGHQFDPKIVEILQENIGEVETIIQGFPIES